MNREHFIHHMQLLTLNPDNIYACMHDINIIFKLRIFAEPQTHIV